jgi:hypothetical protein
MLGSQWEGVKPLTVVPSGTDALDATTAAAATAADAAVATANAAVTAMDETATATATASLDLGVGVPDGIMGTGIPPTPAEATEMYAGAWYGPLNDFLRGDVTAESELETKDLYGYSAQEVAHDLLAPLDEAISNSVLSTDTTVYRGMSSGAGASEEEQQSFVKFIESLQPGTIFRDDAYLSTSSSKAVAARFAGSGPLSASFELKLPAGFNGLKIAGSSEKEVLLQRGLSWEVKYVSEESGAKVITLVPEELAPVKPIGETP